MRKICLHIKEIGNFGDGKMDIRITNPCHKAMHIANPHRRTVLLFLTYFIWPIMIFFLKFYLNNNFNI